MRRAVLLHCSIAAVFAVLSAAAGPAAARPELKGSTDMFRYAANDVVESFPSKEGNFRVFFTRSGVNSVSATDDDKDGFPDHVQRVAAIYEEVLAFYKKLGFRAPIPDAGGPGAGGDTRFDVYLLDFAGKADGHYSRERCTGDKCSGFMVQENDFAGYAYPSVEIGDRILSSHEFFHAVQAAYDVGQSSILSEGTAVWATEKWDPTLDDFEGFLPGYLQRPDRSLDKPVPGPVDPFSYGSALFFQFLDEKLGGGVITKLWEDCENGARGVDDPDWFTALPALLERDFKTSFAAAFAEFVVWNLFTGKSADPMRAYARGAGYPLVKMTTALLPYRDDVLRVFTASSQYVRALPEGRQKMTAMVAPLMPAPNLKLSLFVRRNNRVTGPTEVDFTKPGPLPTVDSAGADDVIALVVNTAQVGESTRGTLCFGTPEEVEPCRAVVAPPDMGPVATDDAGTPMPPPQMTGCSVASAPGARGSAQSAFALALCALALLLRRARR